MGWIPHNVILDTNLVVQYTDYGYGDEIREEMIAIIDSLLGITAVEQKEISQLPTDFELLQNYPNPFNPVTNIDYYLPEATHVSIKIYNLLGKEIKTLVNDVLPAGKHTVQWNGRDEAGNAVTSGIYIYEMRTDKFTRAKKLSLLK